MKRGFYFVAALLTYLIVGWGFVLCTCCHGLASPFDARKYSRHRCRWRGPVKYMPCAESVRVQGIVLCRLGQG